MVMKIDRDASRFKQIVRGKIRENLRKYVTHGEMIGRKGNDLVSIPLPQLDVPHFRYGQNGSRRRRPGRRRSRPADRRAAITTARARARPAASRAQHVLEVDVSLEELAAILGDELALPRIEPKGKANITQDKVRYTSIRRVGPESLRHFKRTYMRGPEAADRHRRHATTRPSRASCRSATTSATAPGTRCHEPGRQRRRSST